MGRGKAEDLRVEGFEDFAGMDLTDGTWTEMGKKTRRNGRIHWKEIAKRAEMDFAQLEAHSKKAMFSLGVWAGVAIVASFMAGAAVGFYFF